MLKVENIRAGYGKIQVIRDINVEVSQKEIISIIGPNGAGKSTLLNCICGIIPVWAGRVFFEDKEITNMPLEKMTGLGISLVQEGSHIFETLTVFDNLLLGAYFRRRKGEKKKIITRNMESVFDIFPILSKRRKQLAGNLSGGERRMLSIGICLMSKPSIMLLDEPSLGLAPITIGEIYQVILGLVENGITVLLVEQNARIALDLSTRAYVMETGKIVLEGRSLELLNSEMVQSVYLGG